MAARRANPVQILLPHSLPLPQRHNLGQLSVSSSAVGVAAVIAQSLASLNNFYIFFFNFFFFFNVVSVFLTWRRVPKSASAVGRCYLLLTNCSLLPGKLARGLCAAWLKQLDKDISFKHAMGYPKEATASLWVVLEAQGQLE